MSGRRLGMLAVAMWLAMPSLWQTAAAVTPEGTWLISQRVAVQVFDCKGLFCGRIVWLRQPALRTRQMCGRTIVWGLTPAGADQWSNGAFFDPENASTYSLSAMLQADGTIAARIYDGISIFGRTEILRRIALRSLRGWC
jgi:uncharacterized protein (DUF2147 family)